MEQQIITAHLILRTPKLEDAVLLQKFNEDNKLHLSKWESLKPNENFEDMLKERLKEGEEGRSFCFFIFLKEKPNELVGVINFTQIFRGFFNACYLGYKIDHRYEGHGLMLEALQPSIRFVFEKLKLHRIMANYMPDNKRSASLLQRLGFQIEGFAKKYLFINGKWEDHILTALNFEIWQSNISAKEITLSEKGLDYREVMESDAAELVSLMKQLGYPIEGRFMRENVDKFMQLPHQKAWVAVKGGQIVGCVATAITHSFHKVGSFLRVIAMVVDEKHRRSGIGKSLMNIVENYAKEQGCTYIELTSGSQRKELGAHDFYHSMGYTDLNEIKKYFAKKLI